jgi:putative peptidoglycan lipid II flippase
LDTRETASVSGEVTQSSFAAMAGILLSRTSGVLRTIIINATFGASNTLDAFNAAFRLPNSLRDLFADGALSAAFMTTLVDEKQKGIHSERQLIAIVLGFFGVTTLIIAFLGMIFSQEIMNLITEFKFTAQESLQKTTFLFRCLIFYLPLTMINAVIMAILGVHQQAFRAMNGSLFLSVGMISGALLLTPLFQSLGWSGIYALAVGALLGAILQMAYQMYPLFSLNLVPFPNLNPKVWFHYKPLHKIIVQMTPRALGQGAMIIALSINTYFATQIGPGFLTYIVTAVIIIQVPIGLFGVATGFTALPALTLMLAKKDTDNFSELLVEGLRTSLWLASFATCCFAFLILPFYVFLFQHGRITFDDSINNCIAICIYSTGILLACCNKVLINVLYALNATRQIIYNAIFYLTINTLLNIYLVPRFGLIGIGFSFGIATSLDFWLNYVRIDRYFHQRGYPGSPYQAGGVFFTTKLLISNILSFVICLSGIGLLKNFWIHHPLTMWSALIILTVGGSLFLLLFLLLMINLGPAHLTRIFHHSLRRERERLRARVRIK